MVRMKTVDPQVDLPGPDGIIFRDRGHKTEFKRLSKRGISLGKSLDWTVLDNLGLSDELHLWIHRLQWDSLVNLRRDGYRNLILEFYSSLEVQTPAYTMSFRLKNQEHIVTPSQLAGWLDCGDEGRFMVPLTMNNASAWIEASGTGMYDCHLSKSTRLTSPAMRILHRYITFSFNARRQTNGQVTVRDLMLMDAAVHDVRVSSGALLIRKLGEIASERGEIGLGMIITVIAEGLGLRIGDEHDQQCRIPFGDANLLNGASLLRMGLVRRTPRGELYVPIDEDIGVPGQEQHFDVDIQAPVQGPDEFRPPEGDAADLQDAPETDTARGKRARTEAGSSSTAPSEPPPPPPQTHTPLSEFQQIMAMLSSLDSRMTRLETRVDEVQTSLQVVTDYVRGVQQTSFDFDELIARQSPSRDPPADP